MSETQGILTVLHPVADVEKATAVYAALLGVKPMVESAYYVGFEAAGQHIGLVPKGPQSPESVTAYWHVADIEAKIRATVGVPVPGRGGADEAA